MDDLLKLEDDRLVLPVTVDKDRLDFIEVVTQKVKAGYLNGYVDPEYIKSLQQISLPFWSRESTGGEGGSMLSHEDGSIIVGNILKSWEMSKTAGLIY